METQRPPHAAELQDRQGQELRSEEAQGCGRSSLLVDWVKSQNEGFYAFLINMCVGSREYSLSLSLTFYRKEHTTKLESKNCRSAIQSLQSTNISSNISLDVIKEMEVCVCVCNYE